MKNYLLDTWNLFEAEIAPISGRAYVLNWLMNQHIKTFENNPQKVGRFSESGLTITDLTNEAEGAKWFFSPHGYELRLENFADEMAYFSSREYSWTLSQIFEICETFLLNIITDFFYENIDYPVRIAVLNSDSKMQKNKIRKTIKQFSRSDNNKLLSIVYGISPYFRKGIKENFSKVNLRLWFDIFTQIRHITIHNRQHVTEKFLVFLKNKNHKKIFDGCCSIKKSNNAELIFFDFEKFNMNFERSKSLMYLIFKAISIDYKLPIPKWKFA